jgi:uncharacterized protein (TIGR03086 family)
VTIEEAEVAQPSEQLQFQSDALQHLMDGVKPDQWGNPTPCAKWTVRDLAAHLVGGGQMFAASFRGESVAAEGEMPDVLGDDPSGAMRAMIADFKASADGPGAMEREVVLPFATLPAQVALDIAKFDLLVHAWDLAHATGQEFDPPDAVVAEARATAEQIVGGLRDGDTFKDEVEAPAGASPVDELAAFTGRSA